MDSVSGPIFVFFGSHVGVVLGPLGRHGAVLGQCWALLERMEKAKGPKTPTNDPQMTSKDDENGSGNRIHNENQ